MKVKICSYLVLSALCLTSCESSDDYLRDVDYNLLTYVLRDNYNLSVFNTAITRTRLDKTLSANGQYTVFSPSDDAFQRITGFLPNTLTGPVDWVSNMANYHIVADDHGLNTLRLDDPQEILTLQGYPVFVKRSVNITNKDTVLMVNGAFVSTRSALCTNGILHVIDRVLPPTAGENLMAVITNRDDLTLFSQAVSRAGMLGVFEGGEIFTVFAPDNSAMAAYGYGTLQSVKEADPAELEAMVKYHMLKGRVFVREYYLSIPLVQQNNVPVDTWVGIGVGERYASNALVGSVPVQMTYGHPVLITYAYSELLEYGALDGERLTLTDAVGNSAKVHLVNRDFAASNGVVHIIDAVLKAK
ncbi:Uncaracterized surface protein containing fasciclin (FAS1) repeats [bacterium A37T11]|nr:Uncaracterized surface protein containing fasciclin (FAS1) repeats [bacterium A37T11]